MTKAEETLNSYWGYKQFRPGQAEIIEAVLDGKDVLALLPTGGGKSICFQVPALMLEGVCLVITPLIALMKDQVENLEKKGIAAACIHAGLNSKEVEHILIKASNGRIQFLYLSPERISTRLMEEYLPDLDVCLIAIDEAHCISQWGYDFRPAYLNISSLRISYPDVPIIALSASATVEVQQDICEKLKFKPKQALFQQSFHRPNIQYLVETHAAKQNRLIHWLNQFPNSTGIVYAKSRKETMQTAELLQQHGFSADYYHAGLTSEERSERQQLWINNNIRIMVCTNAFGMGIDKPDVRIVVHTGMPESLENYYQEAGRAGRDGNPSTAVLLTAHTEEEQLYRLNALRYPEPEELKKMYLDLMNHLQIPAGSGEGSRYNFDINLFSESFDWNPIQASYTLQALAQESLIYLTDKDTRPSKLDFIADKYTLRSYGESFPDRDKVIKGLLRTYEGIYDYPTSIYETHLAKLLSTPIVLIRDILKQLAADKIVYYDPAPEKPQILLLQNRMYRDDLKFDLAALKARKQKHLDRITQIIGYTNNTNICRSVYIGNYFNDKQIQPCGKCDVCTDKKTIEQDDLNLLKDQILKYLSEPISFAELMLQFDSNRIQEIKKIVEYLLEKEIIVSDEWGELSAKKKGPR
jgi:ATP-dependent DNA helicase RecQ